MNPTRWPLAHFLGAWVLADTGGLSSALISLSVAAAGVVSQSLGGFAGAPLEALGSCHCLRVI